MANINDYIDASNIKIGSIIKLYARFFKVEKFAISSKGAKLTCEQISCEEINQKTPIFNFNHDFVKIFDIYIISDFRQFGNKFSLEMDKYITPPLSKIKA